MLPTLSRIFLIIGVVFLIFAGIFYLAARLNIPLGRLPGDIQIQGKGISCLFPLGTTIILSLILTVILNLISRTIGRK
ncbi:MAG: hypothetical protein A2Y53_00380 [Chloroflexi bacterium RBG_16_47_49]|nr:MAG: hypothetical protein A2Y53_00380 [Chloroflexi bacterium RBG_16_47_49]